MNVLASDLSECLGIIGVTTERLHINRKNGLVFTNELKPMASAITFHEPNSLGIFLLSILAINVKASDIKMNRISSQT